MADESACLPLRSHLYRCGYSRGLAAQIRLRGFDAISAYETGNAEFK